MDYGEERLLDQPALVVPFLGPWVGEVDVNHREAVRRDELAEEKAGVGADGAGVEAAAAAQAVAGISPEPASPFDAEEVDFRPGLGLIGEKRSFARADFELDRMVVAESAAQSSGRGRQLNSSPMGSTIKSRVIASERDCRGRLRSLSRALPATSPSHS